MFRQYWWHAGTEGQVFHQHWLHYRLRVRCFISTGCIAGRGSGVSSVLVALRVEGQVFHQHWLHLQVEGQVFRQYWLHCR